MDDAEAVEIEMTIDLANSTAERAGLRVHATEDGAYTSVAYDDQIGRVVVDRQANAQGDRGYRTAPLSEAELAAGELKLRVYVDRGCVEVYTGRFARELKVVGLVNVQYAVQDGKVYVIEVNPRSSRTVPYISKVTGVPMVDLAVRCTLGEKLKDMGYGTGLWRNGKSPYVAVKVPVYSFLKLHGVDTMLSSP